MNAADHPHGGGRGKSKGNVDPKSPWGIPVCISFFVPLDRIYLIRLTYFFRPNPDTRLVPSGMSTRLSLFPECATKESVAEDTTKNLTVLLFYFISVVLFLTFAATLGLGAEDGLPALLVLYLDTILRTGLDLFDKNFCTSIYLVSCLRIVSTHVLCMDVCTVART